MPTSVKEKLSVYYCNIINNYLNDVTGERKETQTKIQGLHWKNVQQ